MRPLPLSVAVLLLATGWAEAQLPQLDAVCGPGIVVTADGAGGVFIDGKAAAVTRLNSKTYEARRGNTVISLTRNPDGSWSGVFTGKGGANGGCTMADNSTGGPGGVTARVIFFNATCGNGIKVHADDGGTVFINGSRAELTTIDRETYEARHGDVTIFVGRNAEGSLVVTYTGTGGTNGICEVDGQFGAIDGI